MKTLLTFISIFATLWMIFTTINLPKEGELIENAHRTFELINAEREKENIVPLLWDNSLEQLAVKHSQTMADTGILEHSNYPYAENIAKGATEPQELYELWKSSAVHHSIYMNKKSRYGAIGIAYKLTNVQIGTRKITINISNGCATFMAY